MYLYQLLANGVALRAFPPCKETAAIEIGQKLLVGGMTGLFYRTVSGEGYAPNRWPDYRVPTPRYDRAMALQAAGRSLVASIAPKPTVITFDAELPASVPVITFDAEPVSVAEPVSGKHGNRR